MSENKESKKTILDKVKYHQDKKPCKERNSMGTSESFYNAYFMIAKCFNTSELDAMSEDELNNLVKLADFASEIFY